MFWQCDFSSVRPNSENWVGKQASQKVCMSYKLQILNYNGWHFFVSNNWLLNKGKKGFICKNDKKCIALFSFRMFTVSVDPDTIWLQIASSWQMVFTTAIPITSYSKNIILFFLHLPPTRHSFSPHPTSNWKWWLHGLSCIHFSFFCMQFVLKHEVAFCVFHRIL